MWVNHLSLHDMHKTLWSELRSPLVYFHLVSAKSGQMAKQDHACVSFDKLRTNFQVEKLNKRPVIGWQFDRYCVWFW